MPSFIPGDVVLGASTVRQVTQSTLGSSPNIIVQYGSTGVTPQALFSDRFEPVANFTTEDIVGLLSALSVTAGLYVAASTAVTIPLRKRSNGSTFVSGSNNFTASGNEGCLIIPESFTARQGSGNVSATVSAHYLSDDGEDPISISKTAAYAAESFTAAFGFAGASIVTSGPTTTTPDLVGWTVNTGITLVKQMLGSGKAPYEAFISQVEPSIDLTFRSIDDLTVFTAGVKSITSLTVSGRRRSDLGGYVSDGSSSHLTFSFGDGLTGTQTLGGGGRNSSEVSLRIMGKTLTASATAALS